MVYRIEKTLDVKIYRPAVCESILRRLLYRLMTVPAWTISIRTKMKQRLYDALKVALVASGTSEVTLVANPFSAVIIHPSPPTAKVVGWSVNVVAANYYCWLQTSGPCAALVDGTLVIADRCMPSDATDGAVEAYPANSVDAGGLEEVVGHVMDIGATGETGLVWACIE